MPAKFKRMKKVTILFFGLMFTLTAFAQQTAQYSQYMFNGLYINPAYAGYREALNMHAYYRSQWTGMPGGPQTMAFAVDGATNNDKVGLGLNIMHDKLGNERNLSLYANYAYRLQVTNDPSKRLAFGLGVGFLNSSFDNASADPTDPESFALESLLLPDARFGVFYSSQTFYAGVGADNLLSTVIFNQKNNRRSLPPVRQYYVTAGGIVPLSTDILLKPSFLVKDAQRGDSRATTVDLNAALLFAERLTVGASYRTAISSSTSLSENLKKPNSVIALLEVVAGDHFRIGYSFDYTLGKVQTYTSGTHEISLGYTFDRRRQRVRTPRYF